MTIRWTPRAANDLAEIDRYLSGHLPSFAESTMQALYEAATSIGDMPHRGKPGVEPGTRELFVPRLPYRIVYRVWREAVEILYIHHTSRVQ